MSKTVILKLDQVKCTTEAHCIDMTGGEITGSYVVNGDLRFDKPIRSKASLCSSGALDLSLSNYFVCNCTGNMTYSFTNVPSDADVVSVVLELHNAGAYALTFPANVQWGGGAMPTFTSGASDLVGFITTDGGSNWRGMGLNFNSAITFTAPAA